jgi:hypothetical protein
MPWTRAGHTGAALCQRLSRIVIGGRRRALASGATPSQPTSCPSPPWPSVSHCAAPLALSWLRSLGRAWMVGRVWGGRPEAGLRILRHEKIFREFPPPFYERCSCHDAPSASAASLGGSLCSGPSKRTASRPEHEAPHWRGGRPRAPDRPACNLSVAIDRQTT